MAGKTKKNQTEESGFQELVNRFKERPFLFGGTVLILIIVIIAFVFVPTIPVMEADRNALRFGSYAGKPITNEDSYFNEVLYETANMAGFDVRSDYSQNFDLAFQVWYQAFMQTLIHMAILDEMRQIGYEAPKEEIDRLVAANPLFHEEGRFSHVRYNSFDRNRRLGIWRSTEESHITGKYMEAFMGLKTSSAEKSFIEGMAFPERSFEAAYFPRLAYPDSEVFAFAAANPDLFKTIHLSRITVSTEREARQLLDSIEKGIASFEDSARAHSTDMDKDRGGDMGLRMAWEIFTELKEESNRNTVTSLRQGQYSPVLQTPGDAWIFFRAEETPYSPDLLQEENLAKVRNYMTRFEGGRVENWLVALVEELLAGAREQNRDLVSHIEFLKEQDLTTLPGRLAVLGSVRTGTFGPVNLNYGNLGETDYSSRLFTNTLDTQTNPALAGAVSSEVFWRNAFFTPLNTPSAPFTLGDSIVVITAVEETAGDEDSAVNIANFYSSGWMYNALHRDMTNAFFASSKAENNFYGVFLPLLFGNLAE
jgi:hypothetical protein